MLPIIPFKAVKIAESFFVGKDKKSAFELVTTFVKIFSVLGIHVVAKGNVNPEGVFVLRQAHCRYAQGSDISDALDAGEVEDVLCKQK